MTSPTREDWHSLLIERDRLLEWNHRVSVCKDHTPEIVDGPCVICDLDHYKALCEELRGALEDIRKRSIRIREQKAIVGIESTFIERVAEAALKKAEGES